ncbi:hypothetical protein NO135_20110, partial [Clostridioides difficile]|nr:hypothetical protein [Clostridioides difficile]
DEWRRVARDVSGRALECGHYIPEEAPVALIDELLAFFEARDAAARRAADGTDGAFEPFTHRLLQTHLARGLQLIPLVALTPAGQAG